MDSRRHDEAEDERGARPGLRWLLLLLAIPVVVLLGVQLQHDRSPTPPAGSGAGTAGRATGAVTSHDLGGQLRGITGRWSLFARSDRSVVRIDVGRDRLTTAAVPALQTAGPVSFVATSVGAVVRPLDWAQGYLVPDGRPARGLTGALSRGGPVVPGPDPAHVWVDVWEPGGRDSIRLIGLGGRADGPVVPKPTNARDWISADGGGHPLLQTFGGTYVVSRAGLRRITTGAVLASGPTGWLVLDCDARNVCTVKDVDRRTWRRTDLAGFPAALADALGRIGQPGRLSPDGRRAALVGPAGDGRTALWLAELPSGRAHRVPVGSPLRGDVGEDALAWSPDGRWLFVVDGRGTVEVVDARTGAVRPLDIDLPTVRQLAVRPDP